MLWMQAFTETQPVLLNPMVVSISSWILWFFTYNEGITQWVFFLSFYAVYCLTAQPIHSSLRSYSGSISGFGDVVMEVLCGLGVSTFIILGLYSVWNVTSNKIFLESQAREEAQLATDAERLQKRLVAIEAQRQKLIQANIGRREREALEQATQAFITAARPKTPPLGKIFTPNSVQQKPSEWLTGGYVPGRRLEDPASRMIPGKRDNSAWLRRTTWYQKQNQEAQTEPQTNSVDGASSGRVAKFLRKKDIERERVRELVEKKVTQVDRAPPEDIRHRFRSSSQTLGPEWATKCPKSPAAADAPSDSDSSDDSCPPPAVGLGETQSLARPGAVGTTPTGDRLFTPYEKRLLGETMKSNRRHSVQGNLVSTTVPLKTPHGHQHTHGDTICSCGLTPLLGPHVPMTSESWPRYHQVHEKSCPKSPYFRPGHPTPGVQLGQGRKTMSSFTTGLTPFLPNQAGPSKFLGNVFSPAKTKFYNTSWNKVRFEDQQINKFQGNGVHYPELSAVVPGQNTRKAVDVIPNIGLSISNCKYREPAQVPLPMHADLEEWEKRYLSAELRAKDLLREKREHEEDEKVRADKLWTETVQRQKEVWEKQREENEQKLIQAQQERREREEIQRRSEEIQRRNEEEREMERVAEEQRIEEQAILDRLADMERRERLARWNQEAVKRIQKLRELEEKKQQEQKTQEEYQRWYQQEQESRNRWEQQAQEAEQVRLLQQQQQQEYQERLQREAERQQQQLQRDIAEQERQQWFSQQNSQWLQQQPQISNTNISSPGSMASWTTAPMHSVARPDNNTSGSGWITIDQRVTPQTNATITSSAWTERSTENTPIPDFWGASPGPAPKRGLEWTPTFRRTSFGPTFSAGIPVTIEEEPESMEIDSLQSTTQTPPTPTHIFGSRTEIVPVNFSPSTRNHTNQQHGNNQDYSSSPQVDQSHADMPTRHSWWQGTATPDRMSFWRFGSPTQPGFTFNNSPAGLMSASSTAREATQNNFFHAKRTPGGKHKFISPKWTSARTIPGGPNSDPGTDLARQAGMRVLDLATLVQMRQRQRQLQNVLTSQRVPTDEVEKLWIEQGLRYDTRTGGFTVVLDEDV